jgi:prepilin-type N-terminal cleavage/methylation domain-containing protein
MVSRSRGYTLLELMIVISIIAIFMAMFLPLIYRPIRDARIAGGVEQAKEVVSACNVVRVKAISSVRNAVNQQVTNTFGPQYTTWTNASVLQGKLSSSYDLPDLNPFGLPYLFKMTDQTCSVAIEVDEVLDSWRGFDIEAAGSNTRIIVNIPARGIAGPVWVEEQKRLLSAEPTR